MIYLYENPIMKHINLHVNWKKTLKYLKIKAKQTVIPKLNRSTENLLAWLQKPNLRNIFGLLNQPISLTMSV